MAGIPSTKLDPFAKPLKIIIVYNTKLLGQLWNGTPRTLKEVKILGNFKSKVFDQRSKSTH